MERTKKKCSIKIVGFYLCCFIKISVLVALILWLIDRWSIVYYGVRLEWTLGLSTSWAPWKSKMNQHATHIDLIFTYARKFWNFGTWLMYRLYSRIYEVRVGFNSGLIWPMYMTYHNMKQIIWPTVIDKDIGEKGLKLKGDCHSYLY
jgi:hypothetical protein